MTSAIPKEPDTSITTALSIGAKTLCNGKEVTVLPVRTGKLFTLIEKVAELTPLFEESRALIASIRTAADKLKKDPNTKDATGISTPDVLRILGKYRTPIYDLITIVTGDTTHEEIDDWELESTIKVLMDIVLAHHDFFLQRVVPQFVGLASLFTPK